MNAGLIFFVVSAASAFATLTTLAVVLHGRPLHTWPVLARVILVLALSGLSVFSGGAWYEATQPKPMDLPVSHSASAVVTKIAPLPVTDATVQKDSPSHVAKAAPPVKAAISVAVLTPPPATPPESSPQEASLTLGGDEITVDEPGKALPEVLAARDDILNMLRSNSYTMRGHLRSTQSEPNAELRGLITTDLTLDMKLVDSRGVVLDVFTATSRGGGFTSGTSAQQARQRLREALQEHRPRERS